MVTGDVHPTAELIRFVVSPEGRLVPDVAGRLPGRGLWVGSDRALIERACRRNLFRRAARSDVTVAGDLPADVEEQLLRRCLDFIGLARRANEAVLALRRCVAGSLQV
ncbi:MAG: DUF448 domain-containing protein, partial [Rhodospirillales bacterium]|nr:DUF448 domain-containing protein [Rhodospirillales bacterium]